MELLRSTLVEKLKLNRLEIDSFKVFERFREDFDCDFIVFDGPNGFGKTTIYDAIQLLFCGVIPRISALSTVINKGRAGKQYSKNLYWNNKSEKAIVIKAEFTDGQNSVSLMRMAHVEDLLNAKHNKPDDFSIFKLYSLSNFDDESSAHQIVDEMQHLKSLFGEHFISNFTILNYMSQDNNSIIIPDHSNKHKSRFDQISHLINLDEVVEKLRVLEDIKRVNTSKIKSEVEASNEVTIAVAELQKKIAGESQTVEYHRLTVEEIVPQWDRKRPLTSLSDYQIALEQVSILGNIVTNIEEIELRANNELLDKFIQRSDLADAVRLGENFKNYDALNNKGKIIRALKNRCKILSLDELDIGIEHLKILSEIPKSKLDRIEKLILQRNTAQSKIEGSVRKVTELNHLRIKIVEKLAEFEGEKINCPLCGFDYKENKILLEAIDVQTNEIESFIKGHDLALKKRIEQLKEVKNEVLDSLSSALLVESKGHDQDLLEDLEKNVTKQERIENIVERLSYRGIKLDKAYSSDPIIQRGILEQVKNELLTLKKNENDILLEGSIEFYKQNFNNIDRLTKLAPEDVVNKKKYLEFQYSQLANIELAQKIEILNQKTKLISVSKELNTKVTEVIKHMTYVKNTYSSKTLGQIESLFHIYSGRLIQNYQRGLGLFIDTDEDKIGNKNKHLSFFTADGTEYDAVLSMSSGQIAALTLSFFLSLNRKYANTAFILIDDPTQSMDEINIASLSDLLRVELQNRQVLISTHEQEVSDYLRYRYNRAGLKAKSINLQNRIGSVEN